MMIIQFVMDVESIKEENTERKNGYVTAIFRELNKMSHIHRSWIYNINSVNTAPYLLNST